MTTLSAAPVGTSTTVKVNGPLVGPMLMVGSEYDPSKVNYRLMVD